MSLKILSAAVALMLFANLPAYAGYDDLKRNYASYRPPAYLSHRSSGSSKVPVTERDEKFKFEIAAVERLKRKWAGALDGDPSLEVFLQPGDRQLARLKTVASDRTATSELLGNPIALEDLETLTLLRNQTVLAAWNRFRATLEAFDQVAGLDEILRRYTAFTEDLTVGVGPMKGQDPVGMKFPFPGIFALKAQVVDQEVRVAKESVEMARREAVTAVRKSFWELFYTRQAQSITDKMIALLDQLESVAVTRYEAGKTSFQDVIKVRITRETTIENRISLGEKQRNIETKINELVNLPEKGPLGRPVVEEPLVSEMEPPALVMMALSHRQELRRLRHRIGKMERMIEMAERMILPSYSMNLSLYADRSVNQVGTQARKPPFMTSSAASVGAGLPKLPWYGAQDAYLRETRQKLLALKKELANSEAATHTHVRQAWFELDRAVREFGLYGKSVVKLSQAALSVSNRGYEAGNLSFADVIGSYTLWLDANLSLEKRRADAGITQAELDRIVGKSMTKNKKPLPRVTKTKP